MADLFGSPENLRGVPMGLWPSGKCQRMDCGHGVGEDDLIGRIGLGDLGCEDCVMEYWDEGDGHGGPF